MITTLIPAYNEEGSIGDTVREFLRFGRVVVCDNGSGDRTGLEAQEAGARVIFEHRRGKGFAIRKLLSYGSDATIVVDGDGAFNADNVEKMVEMVRKYGVDMVIGRRRDINAHNKNRVILRSLFLRILRVLFQLRFRRRISDFLSGFRVMNKKTVELLGKSLKSRGFEVETEMTLIALKQNLKIREVDVGVGERSSGRQKSNIFNVGFPVLKKLLF